MVKNKLKTVTTDPGTWPYYATILEACIALGVCRQTLYRLISEGKIPSFRTGRVWRVILGKYKEEIK
jgi:excisionase family DNA binding protein